MFNRAAARAQRTELPQIGEDRKLLFEFQLRSRGDENRTPFLWARSRCERNDNCCCGLTNVCRRYSQSLIMASIAMPEIFLSTRSCPFRERSSRRHIPTTHGSAPRLSRDRALARGSAGTAGRRRRHREARLRRGRHARGRARSNVCTFEPVKCRCSLLNRRSDCRSTVGNRPTFSCKRLTNGGATTMAGRASLLYAYSLGKARRIAAGIDSSIGRSIRTARSRE